MSKERNTRCASIPGEGASGAGRDIASRDPRGADRDAKAPAREVPTRRYKVVLISCGHFVLARLDELGFSTIGATVPEAMANVREKALAVMSEFDDPSKVPMPDQKMLQAIELPLPPKSRSRCGRARHLYALEDTRVGRL